MKAWSSEAVASEKQCEAGVTGSMNHDKRREYVEQR